MLTKTTSTTTHEGCAAVMTNCGKSPCVRSDLSGKSVPASSDLNHSESTAPCSCTLARLITSCAYVRL